MVQTKSKRKRPGHHQTVSRAKRKVAKPARCPAPERAIQKELDYSARYPKDYHQRCAIAHKATHHRCCDCLVKRSKECHHVAYGKGDIPGVHLFPLCKRCHKLRAHNKHNWIIDRVDPVWQSRSVPHYAERLRFGFKLLSKGVTV